MGRAGISVPTLSPILIPKNPPHPLPPQSHISLIAGCSVTPINIPARSTSPCQHVPGQIQEHRSSGEVWGAADEAVPREEVGSPAQGKGTGCSALWPCCTTPGGCCRLRCERCVEKNRKRRFLYGVISQIHDKLRGETPSAKRQLEASPTPQVLVCPTRGGRSPKLVPFAANKQLSCGPSRTGL